MENSGLIGQKSKRRICIPCFTTIFHEDSVQFHFSPGSDTDVESGPDEGIELGVLFGLESREVLQTILRDSI
jgi:hypothetical protein